MKKIFSLLLCAAVVFTSCKKDDNTIPVSGIELNKTTLSLVEGIKETLTATIKPADVENRELTWSSSDPTVAAVSAGGEVNALKAGTTNIVVTSVVDKTKSATCVVTVTPSTVQVAFSALAANGSDTETTTALTITLDKAITGLTAADISLAAGETTASKGELTDKGNGVYELAVATITKAGEVTVGVAKTGYAVTPASQTVAVKYVTPAVAIGNFYYSDNTYSATFNNTKTCIGVVFWVDPADATKGKIVSLDEGTGKTWADAQNWTSSKTLPSGMTWSVPAKEELQYLYCGYIGVAAQTWGNGNCPVSEVTGAKSAFNAQLTAANGTVFSDSFCWSSTEANASEAWYVIFNSGGTYDGNKNNLISVRVVSAF